MVGAAGGLAWGQVGPDMCVGSGCVLEQAQMWRARNGAKKEQKKPILCSMPLK